MPSVSFAADSVATPAAPVNADPAVGADAPGAAESADAPREEWANSWYFTWGFNNLHGELKESEAQIDRELNRVFGVLLPRWKKPITFGDWSDDFKLWDFHVGAARDLNRYLTWVMTVGGSAGTVANTERYMPLLIPIKMDMDFSRRLWFISTALDAYPLGKPMLDTSSVRSRIMRSVRAIRPLVEISTCYVRLTSIADVKCQVPLAGTIFKKYEETDYDLFYVSPRVGLECPITKRDSVVVSAGYNFFTTHGGEFDNWAVYMFHRHRF